MGKNKMRFLIEKHEPGTIQTISPENAREKRERYLWLKKQGQEWASQCPVTSQVQSTDSPSEVGKLDPASAFKV
jgi:hypothetical protein